MNGNFKITLSGAPLSTNNIYRHHGHIVYMTTTGRTLKNNYIKQAREQWKKPPLEGDIEAVIHLYFSDLRRRDIDNYFKIFLDSLIGIIILDDKQIVKLTIEKSIDKTNPRIELVISKL